MRVATETTEKARHLLMHHGVMRHAIIEIRFLALGRQFAVKEQVAGLQKIAVFGELFDRISAVQQNSFVAVNVGDLRLAGCRGSKTRIVCECAGVLVECTNVHDIRSDGPLLDG